MSKLFNKLLKSCKGDVIKLKETLLSLDKELNVFVKNAETNGVDAKMTKNFLKEYGLNDLFLEKFYFQEAKFRLEEFFHISTPSYELIDEIVDTWFDDEKILNYDLLDDTIDEILKKHCVHYVYYKLDNHEMRDTFEKYQSAESFYEKCVSDNVYDYVIWKQVLTKNDSDNEYFMEIKSWYKEKED